MAPTRCVVIAALIAFSSGMRFRRGDSLRQHAGQLPNNFAGEHIFLRIVNAKGLRDADWFPGSGYADTTVICTYGNIMKRTISVSHDGPDVEWNRILDMGAYQAGVDLRFDLKDIDMFGSSDYMGGSMVTHAEFYPLAPNATKGWSGTKMLSANGGGSNSEAWSTLTVAVEVLTGALAQAAAVQSTKDAPKGGATVVPGKPIAPDGPARKPPIAVNGSNVTTLRPAVATVAPPAATVAPAAATTVAPTAATTVANGTNVTNTTTAAPTAR